jgi:probable addiction module antidote protein
MSDNTEFVLQSVEGLDDLEGVEGVSDFDSAMHLKTKEAIAAYLSFAAQSGDAEHLKAAMKTAARAESMAKLAEAAGITREGAYKSLKPGTKTQLQTAMAMLDALGMTIKVVTKESLAHDNSYALAA